MWSPIRGAGSNALTSGLLPSVLVTASASILLSGCGTAADVVTSMGPLLKATEAATGPSGVLAALTAPGAAGAGNVEISPRQRDYLDALAVAAVPRSNDLMALSIGSYVCQARAAGQGDRAVWDFVFPLVRGDLSDQDNDSGTVRGNVASVHDATVAYIRIATERLC